MNGGNKPEGQFGGSLADVLNRHSVSKRSYSEQPKDCICIPADIKADNKEVMVFLDLPGMDEDEIEIHLESNRLSISGERSFDHDNEDAEDFIRLERPWGHFEWAAELPGKLYPAGISAKYKRGVLKVRVPKASQGE